MGESWNQALRVSVNISLLAIFYTTFGAFISYVFYYLFDEFDDEWEKKSMFYKIIDVSIELSIVVLCSFWISKFMASLPPIIPIPLKITREIESYTADFFFVIALFLFLDDLTKKLKYLQEYFFSREFNRYLPQYGSAIDFTLSYTKPAKSRHGSGSGSHHT